MNSTPPLCQTHKVEIPNQRAEGTTGIHRNDDIVAGGPYEPGEHPQQPG
ncbi:MAG: hypothetical protein U1E83_11110 [Methylotetracoccus sp.]